jgi:hypothetical protein
MSLRPFPLSAKQKDPMSMLGELMREVNENEGFNKYEIFEMHRRIEE